MSSTAYKLGSMAIFAIMLLGLLYACVTELNREKPPEPAFIVTVGFGDEQMALEAAYCNTPTRSNLAEDFSGRFLLRCYDANPNGLTAQSQIIFDGYVDWYTIER